MTSYYLSECPLWGDTAAPLFFQLFWKGGCWAGSWRVLGGFSASSWRVLGECWSKSGLWTAKLGAKSVQNRARWLPRASKIEKIKVFLGTGFGRLPKVLTRTFFQEFGFHFGLIWEPTSLIFRVIFGLGFWMDFWRLLAAFWEPFWWIFGCLFWYFSRLCGKSRTPRIYCK